jgi:ubiquinol-cytochrome c reductase iron-sulfur subunit
MSQDNEIAVTSGHEAANRAAQVPADPFADPGLPVHVPRITDIDARAAKRAERQVSLLFLLSAAATIAFCCCYTLIPKHEIVDVWPFGGISASNLALGLCLGIALFSLGAGAIHWARRLMTDEEIVQERHPLRSDDESREQAIAAFQQGAEESGFAKRPLIRRSLLTAMGVLPFAGIWMLRDLGPQPGTVLRHTAWKRGSRIINQNTNQPLRPEDLTVGSLLSANPAGLDPNSDDYDDQLAKAAIMVVRLEPSDIISTRERDWGYEGIVAFSKICTHVGCPLGLYEQQSHHMLCPCHQSTFDLSDGGKVIFGPAARSLPQLAITVDDEGYLVARGDFSQPVGPSFWERG